MCQFCDEEYGVGCRTVNHPKFELVDGELTPFFFTTVDPPPSEIEGGNIVTCTDYSAEEGLLIIGGTTAD